MLELLQQTRRFGFHVNFNLAKGQRLAALSRHQKGQGTLLPVAAAKEFSFKALSYNLITVGRYFSGGKKGQKWLICRFLMGKFPVLRHLVPITSSDITVVATEMLIPFFLFLKTFSSRPLSFKKDSINSIDVVCQVNQSVRKETKQSWQKEFFFFGLFFFSPFSSQTFQTVKS